MKKIVILILALALAACGAPATEQPVAAPPEPSATPVVVVQTVVVEATQAATDVPPTAVPPTVAPVVVTVVVEATQASVQPTAAQPSGDAPIALDNNLGKGVFINMTVSGPEFSLQCFPRDITFNITSNNLDIVDAELYYRIVDQPKALYYSEWKNAGKMERKGNGNFSMVFSGEDVHPDLRLELGWFEFQFIGLNKGGAAVDRTQQIEKLVTYRIHCP